MQGSLCPGGSLSGGGALSRGVSVQEVSFRETFPPGQTASGPRTE